MKLPGAERALVDVDKLRGYCLNPAHARGRHKARVFASALGIMQPDADWLKARLLEAARQHQVTKSAADEYGSRYIVEFECIKEDRRAIVRSAWIVRRGEDFPRLTTCYVLSE